MKELAHRVFPLCAALAATYAGSCLHSSSAPSDSGGPRPVGAHPSTPEAPKGTSAPVESRAVAEPIFEGGLKGGWQDWGWAPREVNGPGPAKVRFDNWGGWILAKPDGLAGSFGGVLFRAKEPAGQGEFIEVRLEAGSGSKFPRVKVSADQRTDVGDGWVEVLVPMSALDPDGLPFDRVVFQAFRPMDPDWVSIDKVALTKASPHQAVPLDPSTLKQVSMSVDCRSRATKIDPMIYGIAYYQPDEKTPGAPWAFGATARRWGGNTTSTYNWEISAWNTGNDWYFENHDVPSYAQFMKENADHSVQSVLTVPIMGWVSKDTTSSSFPVSVYGAQEGTDPYRPEAGNGKAKGTGKILPARMPPSAYKPITPAFVKSWVEAIRAQDAKTGKRSVSMYILDNEPALWSQNHRDAHPDPASYDELVQRTIDFGTAIREADPDAVIAGPAEWGWTGYMYSAKDLASGGPVVRPDRRAHGDLPVIAYYLKALAGHERTTHVRILDVLDLHAYPQGDRVYSEAADADVAALRIRSTRLLWDPDYVDESWIKEPVKLLPRMREWVDAEYPGRGISIGEWNFGGEQHMSGAIAIADALGRFAQFGVTSAFYWAYPPEGSPGMWAFRAYRNYDGQGGRFLDWYTPSRVGSGEATLFVSRDESGQRLVALVVNPSKTEAINVKMDVSACGQSVQQARAYSYEGAPTGFAPRTPSKAGGTVSQAVAPYSISVFDIEMGAPSAMVR